MALRKRSERGPASRFAGGSLALVLVFAFGLSAGLDDPTDLDRQLRQTLADHGFTGTLSSQIETKLGRRLNTRLADLGRLLFFDPLLGLNDDNACAGCHSPMHGFADSQSIAIGIDSNEVVGPNREGPRNQRRSPLLVNIAFAPELMWNGRFFANSGDPFNNSMGFTFPPPEGTSLSYLPHLLTAQAFIPPTERVEMAGFDFPGNSDDIRAEVMRRINATPRYRFLFGRLFPAVRTGGPVTLDMYSAAIAEFTFTLTFADAPIDRFARGSNGAMSVSMKRGARLFFGKAGCVSCHAVSGQSNEMFSDFDNHVAGIPQIMPALSNVVFDGPGQNEDFGLEQISGDPNDRYKFRTTPLRNVALQPTFFHNGAFVSLSAALRYHLDAIGGAASYTTDALAEDLRGPMGPIEPVLLRIDPLLADPIVLTNQEFGDLLAFVSEGLLDNRARADRLRHLVPPNLPSGRRSLVFER